MPKLVILVGPPGSGKSTYARNMVAAANRTLDTTEQEFNKYISNESTVYINQDSQGGDHVDLFMKAIDAGKDVYVDRMNFNKQQRSRYLEYAKPKGYETKIMVIHQSYDTCLARVRDRFGRHETINEEKAARGALQTFFGKYERPLEGEADIIEFVYPDGEKLPAIICDLDGTLCDVEHRRHHVRKPAGEKKDWRSFFLEMEKDAMIMPVYDILTRYQHEDIHQMNIVFCSGRPDDYRTLTKEWLAKTGLRYSALYMRSRHDSRQDDIVKEIILDFEILTRFKPLLMLDDRDQVVKMWRRRGFMCLQVAEGDF